MYDRVPLWFRLVTLRAVLVLAVSGVALAVLDPGGLHPLGLATGLILVVVASFDYWRLSRRDE